MGEPATWASAAAAPDRRPAAPGAQAPAVAGIGPADAMTRERVGPMMIAMSGGVALVSRENLAACRAAAAAVSVAPAGLTTVAVPVSVGRFLVGDHGGGSTLQTGQELAATLASLPIYGTVLRLWLQWPDHDSERRLLAHNLVELADTVGAVVWAPPVGGGARVSDTGGDLRAVDGHGNLADWEVFDVPAPDARQVIVAAVPAPEQVVPPTAVWQDAPETSVYIARPRVRAAAADGGSHGVHWLPARPQVNDEDIDVYVASAWDAGQVAARGVPGAYLFLLARLDPARLARELGNGYVLRLRVAPGGAVDVLASAVRRPAHLQHLLTPADTFLLPAGWLGHSTVTAIARVTDGTAGGLEQLATPRPAEICCVGARHGADGLPSEAPAWPAGSLRSAVTAYVLIAEGRPVGDWVALHRRRPAPVPGFRLVQVRVGRRRALDVAATGSMLEPLPAIRSQVADLRSQGVELLLPRRSYARVTARRTFDAVGDHWRRAEGPEVTFEALAGGVPAPGDADASSRLGPS